jgi:hypothetical protein
VSSDNAVVFIADRENYKVRKLTLHSRVVTTLAGDGTANVLDGMGVAAQFNLQTGVRTPSALKTLSA